MQKAFADRYGQSSDALRSLPRTLQWLASVKVNSEQEWEEHICNLSALTGRSASSSQGLPPVTSLRTGGSVLMAGNQDLPIPSAVTSGTGLHAELDDECLLFIMLAAFMNEKSILGHFNKDEVS